MILDILGRIARADDTDKVWEIATGYLVSLGFSRINYGLTRFRFENSIGNPDDALYLSTTDAAYMNLYFKGGHFARTPVFRWIMNNTGATTWRWVEEDLAAGKLSESEIEALKVNEQLGVNAGVAISFPETSQRIKGALGLIADREMTHDDVDAIWLKNEAEIMAVANMMHLKIASLPLRSARRPLTDRQREALEWVADGKTTQDIAILMGISVAMVEKHLRLARDSLDVETTAQAVAKGTLLNMIFMRGPAT